MTYWKDSLNVPVSSQGEWAAKRFYGDPRLAAAYLPVAYALLGSVKNRMAYGDVGFGHQQIELPDGTRIRVLRNGNQNILEIDASIPTAKLIAGLGEGGLIFYPRTDSKPFGIYPPGIRPAYHPLPARTPPWLPYSTLSYVYDANSKSFSLTAKAPRDTQAGNQFFLSADNAIYSWWHSPCGDGPLTRFANTSISYAPYISGGTLRYFTPDKFGITLLPIVYRNGSPWFLVPLDAAEFLAGFWAGSVEVEKDVFVQRYVAAIYSTRCQIIIKVFENPRTLPNNMVAMDEVHTTSSPLVFGGSKINTSFESVSWPIRITSTGNKAASILINDSDPAKYDEGRANQMVVVEISITHQKDNFVYEKLEETIYPMGVNKQTYRKNYRYNWVLSTSVTGYISAIIGEQYVKEEYEYEFVGATDRYPVAISYSPLDELRIAFVVLGEGNYFSTAEALSSVNINVRTDTYTQSPTNPLKARREQEYTISATGFARSLHSYHSQRANSNFSVIDNNSKVLVPSIHANNSGEYDVSGTYSDDTYYLQDSLNDTQQTILKLKTVLDMNGSQKSNGLVGTGYVRYIDLNENVVLYYVVNSVDGTYSTRVKHDYRRDDSTSILPPLGGGNSHRELENNYNISGTAGTIREIGISLTLSINDTKYEYADSAEEKQETSSGFQASYLSVNNTVITNTSSGTFAPPFYDLVTPTMSQAINNTCNINSMVRPQVPEVRDFLDETVTELDVPASEITFLFFPTVPIDFSYVRDKRVTETSVWAYGLKFLWATSFNDSIRGIIPMELKDTKTDSTFGPLTQHIFTLDTDGRITDIPINDPTLVVNPIGLF